YVDEEPLGPADVYVRGVVDVDGDRVLYSGSPADRPGDVSLWLADLKSGLTTQAEEPDVGPSPEGMLSGRRRGDRLVLARRSMDFTGVRACVGRRPETKTHRIASFAAIPVLPERRVEFWRAGERRIPSALVLPSWYREGQSAPLPVLMAPDGIRHAQRVLHARGAFLGAQWFAEQGFAVLIADGRGTPGIGVDWEQAVHHDRAGPALEDQVTALEDAARRFDCLDTSRVGVQGWSFGGYLATLAVLRRPDVYHAAVAGAPVIDWKLYDTHYT